MVSQLIRENARLKQRVVQLEEKLGRTEAAAAGAANPARLLELLRSKDVTLREHADELEKKNRALQESVQTLEGRNQDLQTTLSALQLYQQIFDNEPSALLGVDIDGHVVQFNAAAIQICGEALVRQLFQPLTQLEVPLISTGDVPRLLDAALKEAKTGEVRLSHEGAPIEAVIYPLRDGEGTVKGAMVRLSRAKKV